LEDVEELDSSSAPRFPKGMGKTKLATSKNENHPLLKYLLKSTTSKLKRNFTITNAKDLTKLFVAAMCFHFAPPHSSSN
jgi:phage terminase large subunit-like protein